MFGIASSRSADGVSVLPLGVQRDGGRIEQFISRTVTASTESSNGTAYLAHENDTECAELAWSLDATSDEPSSDDDATTPLR